MRPKLHADTVYSSMNDALYIRRNNAALKLRGKSIYSWFEHLVPFLDGNTTLQEITEGLDDERKALVSHLIETLLAKNFLKDVSFDHPHTLSQEELEIYKAEISFIDSFQSSAAYRFESFRNKHLLIIGSGLTLTALVQASLRCGIKQLDVMITDECASVPASQPDTLALFTRKDPAQVVRKIEMPDWNNDAEVLEHLRSYDALLHISDRPMLARVQRLNRWCAELKKMFVPAIIINAHALVGPIVSTESEGCWECAWRRLQANTSCLSEQLSPYTFYDQSDTEPGRFFAVSTATLAANRLIFELLKYVTQAGPVEIIGRVVDIDLSTLSGKSRPFVPHPHCSVCLHPPTLNSASFSAQLQQIQQQDSLTLPQFSQALVRCTDSRFGLFSAITEEDFLQVPLAVCKVQVANAMLQPRLSRKLEVIGVGTDLYNARLRTSQRACEIYAAHLVDRRQLLSRAVLQQQGVPAPGRDHCIGSALRGSEIEEWLWGLNLSTQQPCLVPATHVFPVLCDEEPGTDAMRGVGSGMSWSEAVCHAMIDWCAFLTLEQLNDAGKPYPQVDLTRVELTPEGRHFRDLLATTGELVTVYDVTGPLQVPTFAVCMNRNTVAYGVHVDSVEAISHALEQAVQHYQAIQTGQLVYDVPPVVELPLALRGDTVFMATPVSPKAWPVRQEWLLQRLSDNRMQVVVVPLHHDPALKQVLPYIVRVFLVRA